MTIEQDIAMIARQEELLQFEKFDENTAWEIGSRLRTEALKRGVSVEIDITLGEHRLFTCAMVGTTPNNSDWVRRKINTVRQFQRSSYGFGRQLDRDGDELSRKYALPAHDYVAAGGCFPIRVKGAGFVGTITVSGLPQRDDHKMVVAVLAEFLGESLQNLQLD